MKEEYRNIIADLERGKPASDEWPQFCEKPGWKVYSQIDTQSGLFQDRVGKMKYVI